jgi:non-heme chloroperoxidase
MPYLKSQKDPQAVNIYYEDWGTGKPVVLIHGWPVSHEMWEYQMTILPRHGFRCIAYDRRGFGKSDKPWNGYDYTTLAGDLNALLEALDLRDVTLVAFSMAGGEAIRYCTLFQDERVSKIILVSSIVPYMLKTETNPEGIDKKAFDDNINELVNDRPAFLSSFGKTFFGETLVNRPVSTETLDWMQGLALQGSPRATIECLKSFSQTDFRDELTSIAIPTLIIHGDADKTVPILPTSEQAAHLIPDATYKRYEGAPHGLFLTDKEELTADIIQFIQEGTVALNFEEQEQRVF